MRTFFLRTIKWYLLTIDFYFRIFVETFPVKHMSTVEKTQLRRVNRGQANEALNFKILRNYF